MRNLAEKLKFFSEFVRAPSMVGSILPTSPRVIDSLLDRVDWSAARLFVEYGPGVGTFTRPILERLRPDGRLIAIDTSQRFINYLSDLIADPRLHLVHGSAADAESVVQAIAPGEQADYVLSGLPFSTLPKGVGDAIVGATFRILRPEGSFLVYQYSGIFLPLLRSHFPVVARARVWNNIPPCVVAAARK